MYLSVITSTNWIHRFIRRTVLGCPSRRAPMVRSGEQFQVLGLYVLLPAVLYAFLYIFRVMGPVELLHHRIVHPAHSWISRGQRVMV